MSLRNSNQVLPVPPENLPRASHRTEHKRHALPEFQDLPGCAPYPADFSPWLLLHQGHPSPRPLGCLHRAFAPAVLAACPNTFTGQAPSCHSGLNFNVTAREAWLPPSKRMPQSVPTIFPAVLILSSYSICDCVMDMNEAPSSVSR